MSKREEHAKYLAENKDTRKAIIMCRKHGYVGNIPPMVSGCSNCWLVYFTKQLGQVRPEKREEMLGNLERSIRNMTQMEDVGLMDFQPYLHPEFQIDHNVEG